MEPDDFVVLDKLEYSVNYMISDNWKERFIAEYAQLSKRIEDLIDMLWSETTVDKCPMGLLSLQLEKMQEYQEMLSIRADIYGLNMEEEIKRLNKK